MSQRLERVNAAIKELAAEFLRENLSTEEVGWVSVTGVKTSPDLGEARIFFTVFPDHKEKAALERLKRLSGALRGYIAKRLRIKRVPKISFEVDNFTKLVERGKINPEGGS